MANQPQTVVLRFTHPHAQYNAGERASFDVDFAAQAIAAGHAVVDDPHAPAAVVELDKDTESDAPDTRTHAMTVEQILALVPTITALEDLQKLWEGEKQHPNHKGGRAGALKAMRARAEELQHVADEKAAAAASEQDAAHRT